MQQKSCKKGIELNWALIRFFEQIRKTSLAMNGWKNRLEEKPRKYGFEDDMKQYSHDLLNLP